MANATNRWLDRLAAWDKAKGGSGSDYRIAQLLGIERQRISRYRREADKAMGDDIAVQIADLLEIHPRIVIGEVHTELGRSERERRYWMAEVKSAAKKAALVGAAILTAQIVPALSRMPVPDCILCKVPRGPDRRAPQPLPRIPQLIPGRARPLRTLHLARAV